MSSFIVKGGDGYKMIPENLIEHRNTGFLDNDLLGEDELRRILNLQRSFNLKRTF